MMIYTGEANTNSEMIFYIIKLGINKFFVFEEAGKICDQIYLDIEFKKYFSDIKFIWINGKLVYKD